MKNEKRKTKNERFRLQEITEKVGLPFGGLAIIAFGDMMQLKPVIGRYMIYM